MKFEWAFLHIFISFVETQQYIQNNNQKLIGGIYDLTFMGFIIMNLEKNRILWSFFLKQIN